MHVLRINKPIVSFDVDHPARRFLEAFIECRKEGVGQELPPPYGKGVDQEWWSKSDGLNHRYSRFAYEYLSFDIELDGWLQNAESYTESEKAMLGALPRMRTLMTECREAAEVDDNGAIVDIVDRVLALTSLWETCIRDRFPR